VIWPIALAFMEKARVLAAWCELRNGFRHFRADRIRHLTPLRMRYPRGGHAGQAVAGGTEDSAARVLLTGTVRSMAQTLLIRVLPRNEPCVSTTSVFYERASRVITAIELAAPVELVLVDLVKREHRQPAFLARNRPAAYRFLRTAASCSPNRTQSCSISRKDRGSDALSVGLAGASASESMDVLVRGALSAAISVLNWEHVVKRLAGLVPPTRWKSCAGKAGAGNSRATRFASG